MIDDDSPAFGTASFFSQARKQAFGLRLQASGHGGADVTGDSHSIADALASVDCVHLTGSRDSATTVVAGAYQFVFLGARPPAMGAIRPVSSSRRVATNSPVVCHDATCFCGMTTTAPAA